MCPKLRRHATALLVSFLSFGVGCEAGPAGFPAPCPLELVGTGFTFSLPCGAREEPLEQTTAGISYEKLFLDDEAGVAYAFEVVPVGGQGGVTVGDQGNLKYDGLFKTSSGDQLIIATLRLDQGDIRRALGILADGSVIRVNVFPTSSLNDFRIKIASLDLLDTDGSGLISEMPTGTKMVAPISSDSIVLLSDLTMWEFDDDERFAIGKWQKGDFIASHDGAAFFVDGYLIRYPDFVSVPARYLGKVELFSVSSVEINATCSTVHLSNGAMWSACSDKPVLDSMQAGEAVAYYRISSVNFLFRIADGRSALVVN